MREIIVVIDPDGNVIMEGIGFKGTACDEAMRSLEKSIGRETYRQNKPEYTTQSTQKVGGEYPKGRWP